LNYQARQAARAPRIAPLAPNEQHSETRELLHTVGDDAAAANLFATIVRHPRIFKRWTIVDAVLRDGWLPERDRELLVLRTSHLCGCHYLWAHHVPIAKAAGLRAEELTAVREGPKWPGWSPWDAAVLTAADELRVRSRLSDTTWAALAQGYDERMLIEVTMLVGNCHVLAFTVNSVGVELEHDER
jgi:AhpD family alkylhydroperoxidase